MTTPRKSEKGFQLDVDEALSSGAYACGTTGSGKSDIAMYVADELMKEGVRVYVVDPAQDWQQRSNIPNYYPVYTVDQRITVHNASTIFDTSRLYVSEQKLFMEALCEYLYHYSVEQRPQDRKWRFIIFEEAHLVYPEGSFRSNKKSASLQLVTVGRNFKLRFMVITPFSSNIDKMLIKTTKQRYFGWTCEKNDLDYLRGFLGSDARKLEDLQAGQFIYHNPASKMLRKIQIKPHKRTTPLIQLSSSTSMPKTQPQADAKGYSLLFAFLTIAFIMGALLL